MERYKTLRSYWSTALNCQDVYPQTKRKNINNTSPSTLVNVQSLNQPRKQMTNTRVNRSSTVIHDTWRQREHNYLIVRILRNKTQRMTQRVVMPEYKTCRTKTRAHTVNTAHITSVTSWTISATKRLNQQFLLNLIMDITPAVKKID